MWKIIKLRSLFQFNLNKAVKNKQKPLSFLEEENGIVKLRVFTNLEESFRAWVWVQLARGGFGGDIQVGGCKTCCCRCLYPRGWIVYEGPPQDPGGDFLNNKI